MIRSLRSSLAFHCHLASHHSRISAITLRPLAPPTGTSPLRRSSIASPRDDPSCPKIHALNLKFQAFFLDLPSLPCFPFARLVSEVIVSPFLFCSMFLVLVLYPCRSRSPLILVLVFHCSPWQCLCLVSRSSLAYLTRFPFRYLQFLCFSDPGVLVCLLIDS
jgi:hypothetical protein